MTAKRRTKKKAEHTTDLVDEANALVTQFQVRGINPADAALIFAATLFAVSQGNYEAAIAALDFVADKLEPGDMSHIQ